MTHFVIDVTHAHVHVIDYVHLCAVHLVRRVPLDLLMDNTSMFCANKKQRMKRRKTKMIIEKKKCVSECDTKTKDGKKGLNLEVNF